MKVLVACEFSGVVREAFRKRGHDAWSCDLLPSEDDSKFHYQQDVLSVLNGSWDLMIAHPPCTYLAKCGLHYLKTRPERIEQHKKAFEFVKALWNCPISKICIENPAGWLNTNWIKPMQIIQPYYFGHNDRKETCLWLKGLPPLFRTNECDPIKPKKVWIRKTGPKAGKGYGSYWRDGKNAHDRSRTFQGIADAMAEQWG
jgi:hypothetical protein